MIALLDSVKVVDFFGSAAHASDQSYDSGFSEFNIAPMAYRLADDRFLVATGARMRYDNASDTACVVSLFHYRSSNGSLEVLDEHHVEIYQRGSGFRIGSEYHNWPLHTFGNTEALDDGRVFIPFLFDRIPYASSTDKGMAVLPVRVDPSTQSISTASFQLVAFHEDGVGMPVGYDPEYFPSEEHAADTHPQRIPVVGIVRSLGGGEHRLMMAFTAGTWGGESWDDYGAAWVLARFLDTSGLSVTFPDLAWAVAHKAEAWWPHLPVNSAQRSAGLMIVDVPRTEYIAVSEDGTRPKRVGSLDHVNWDIDPPTIMLPDGTFHTNYVKAEGDWPIAVHLFEFAGDGTGSVIESTDIGESGDSLTSQPGQMQDRAVHQKPALFINRTNSDMSIELWDGVERVESESITFNDLPIHFNDQNMIGEELSHDLMVVGGSRRNDGVGEASIGLVSLPRSPDITVPPREIGGRKRSQRVRFR